MQQAHGLVAQARGLSAAPANSLSQTLPGSMFFNALPTLPDEDPRIDKQIYLDIAMTSQFDGQGDVAAAPYFRLSVPFYQVVAFEMDAMPVEAFKLSPKTQANWNAPDSAGLSKGDLRFGAKFDVVSENDARPEIGLSVLTKTTTGKDSNDRQFTDAPAYYINTLWAKNLLKDDRFLKKIRLLVNLGFFAWQQTDRVGQDDALTFGSTLVADFDKGVQAQIEYRGYSGWQGDDSPRVLSFGAKLQGQSVDLSATFNVGFQDAPPNEARLDLTFHGEAPKFPLK